VKVAALKALAKVAEKGNKVAADATVAKLATAALSAKAVCDKSAANAKALADAKAAAVAAFTTKHAAPLAARIAAKDGPLAARDRGTAAEATAGAGVLVVRVRR